ncbi:MAG: 50S ribosomal protein L11 methyltransferase [Candidatus Altiarchaeota archaeon]
METNEKNRLPIINSSFARHIRELSVDYTNALRAEQEKLPGFPFQVAKINLDDTEDPSAISGIKNPSVSIVTDKHTYTGSDRIFPVNQDENTVFAGYVYEDTFKQEYHSVLDLCTGSGVLAIASKKAGAKHVLATDINPRSFRFVDANNVINSTRVKVQISDLFRGIKGKFDKITLDPPFMGSPSPVFPLHAQSQGFGTETVIEPVLSKCWEYLNKMGCVQIIAQSFAGNNKDSFIDVLENHIPQGWSYSIKHVFPEKNIPLHFYTSIFKDYPGFEDWKCTIEEKGYEFLRFYMLTIRDDGGSGLQEETFSTPRKYNLIYPPTLLSELEKRVNKPILLHNPVSENEIPFIGHYLRLSRYSIAVYQSLKNSLGFG